MKKNNLTDLSGTSRHEPLDGIRQAIITMAKSVWSVADLAAVLGISQSRVRRLAADRALPSYKQNGSLYFRRSEVEAWLTMHRQPAAADTAADTDLAVRRVKKSKESSNNQNINQL